MACGYPFAVFFVEGDKSTFDFNDKHSEGWMTDKKVNLTGFYSSLFAALGDPFKAVEYSEVVAKLFFEGDSE